jgi:hypothetical protein
MKKATQQVRRFFYCHTFGLKVAQGSALAL